jgi:hypothetical protein
MEREREARTGNEAQVLVICKKFINNLYNFVTLSVFLYQGNCLALKFSLMHVLKM